MKVETSRISVMIDKELENRLREKQTEMIGKTKGNVTFSQVVNLVLKEGLKLK